MNYIAAHWWSRFIHLFSPWLSNFVNILAFINSAPLSSFSTQCRHKDNQWLCCKESSTQINAHKHNCLLNPMLTEGKYTPCLSPALNTHWTSFSCFATRVALGKRTHQHGFRAAVRVKQLSSLQTADKRVSWIWADDADTLSVPMPHLCGETFVLFPVQWVSTVTLFTYFIIIN